MEEMENAVQEEVVTESKQAGLTQDQVDEAIANRLKREREKFAKTLGIETYNEEAIEGFLGNIKAKETQISDLTDKISSLTADNLNKEFTLTALKEGVKSENIERAVKLASLEISEDVSIEQAIKNVIEDFPMLKGESRPVKVGNEVKSTENDKTEIDRYLENKYSKSKYYKK